MSSESILRQVHQDTLEPVPIRVFERLHIRFDAGDASIVFDPDKKRASFMIEEAGNRFENDLLKRTVDPLLTPVPPEGRFELKPLAFTARDKQRQLLVKFAFEKKYLGLLPRETHVIHAEPEAQRTPDRRVNGAHGKHFKRECIDQPAHHEADSGAAAHIIRQTELIPEYKGRHRMENGDAECSAKQGMGD